MRQMMFPSSRDASTKRSNFSLTIYHPPGLTTCSDDLSLVLSLFVELSFALLWICGQTRYAISVYNVLMNRTKELYLLDKGQGTERAIQGVQKCLPMS